MDGKYPIAAIATLFADASRSAMLLALLDGSARSAGELAVLARATPQSTSMHLAKLVESRLLRCRQSGRHRYYCLAGPDVASAIEALGVLATGLRPVMTSHDAHLPPLRVARTCYDHLAGLLGVGLCDALKSRRYLRAENDGLAVTRKGEEFFKRVGWWPESQPSTSRRPLIRACLDWTERRSHLSGALGAAIMNDLLQRRWVVRQQKPRVLKLTTAGANGLREMLGLELPVVGDKL